MSSSSSSSSASSENDSTAASTATPPRAAAAAAAAALAAPASPSSSRTPARALSRQRSIKGAGHDDVEAPSGSSSSSGGDDSSDEEQRGVALGADDLEAAEAAERKRQQSNGLGDSDDDSDDDGDSDSDDGEQQMTSGTTTTGGGPDEMLSLTGLSAIPRDAFVRKYDPSQDRWVVQPVSTVDLMSAAGGGQRWHRALWATISETWLAHKAGQQLQRLPMLAVMTMFLVLLGLLVGSISATMDMLSDQITQGKFALYDIADLQHTVVRYWLWLAYYLAMMLVVLFFAAVVGELRANGSGIPEVLSIMSGATLDQFLDIRTLVAKVMGISVVVGIGMFVGKAGPMVHISAATAFQLARLPLFRRLRLQGSTLQSLLGAAAATGLASHWGTPIGAIFFAIEITSSYFPTRNLWLSFVGATTSALTSRVLRNYYRERELALVDNNLLAPFSPVQFPPALLDIGYVELLMFALLGLGTGCMAAFFIRMSNKMFLIRRFFLLRHQRLAARWRWTRRLFHPKAPLFYVDVLVMTVLTASLSFPQFFGQYLSIPLFPGLADLWSPQPLWTPTNNAAGHWGLFPVTQEAPTSDEQRRWLVILNLIIYTTVRLLITACSVVLPFPAGVIAPQFPMGAGLGRITGEILLMAADPRSPDRGGTIFPGAYAIVGSACMLAGVTQGLSAAVVVLEITNQLQLVIPMFLAVTIAVTVSRYLTFSFFQRISVLRDLPLLIEVNWNNESTTAADLMQREPPALPLEGGLREMRAVLQNNKDPLIPVVKTLEDGILVGAIPRAQVEALVATSAAAAKKPAIDDASSADAVDSSAAAAAEPKPSQIRAARAAVARWKLAAGHIPMAAIGRLDHAVYAGGRRHRHHKAVQAAVQPVPIRVLDNTPIGQVHMLFINLRLTNLFVTRDGRLVGLITRKMLKDFLVQTQEPQRAGWRF